MGVNEDDINYKPKIDKEKTKDMFKYMEELKFATMDNLAKSNIDPNDEQQQ